jgi:hypothetical protein
VISDSNQTPIAGAQVAATNDPAYCGSDTSTVTVAANTQTTATFTTNGTEWYSLNSLNNAGYSFVIKYSDNSYNFTAALAPLSETCATLFIPSGRTSVYTEGFQTSPAACTSSMTTTAGVIIIPQGTEYQVQSSYDCVAGSTNQTFSVTAASVLQGAISAGSPGVTIYVATVQEAGTTSMGHPAAWIYSSGLTNSTGFAVPLSAGSYVFWMEGADLGCGATVVMPLEQLTTVTVTQAVTLMPA